MAEINDLSTTDNDNTGRFPESQLPNTVNDGARALEGMLARAFADTIDGAVTTGGTTTAYTYAANRGFSAYYDGLTLAVEWNATCGASPTINVTPNGGSALGAKALYWPNGDQVASGELVADGRALIQYDGTNFQVIGPRPPQTLGTAASLDVGTSANNIVQLDGSARLPAVNASQLTDLPATVDQTARDIAMYAFIKADDSSGLQGPIFGDSFTSDSLATKTNATWSAGQYANSKSKVGLDDADRTGSSNIASDEANPSTISNGSSDEAAWYDLGGTAVTGDFDFTWAVGSAFGRWMHVGVFAASEVGTFNAGTSTGGVTSMTASFTVRHNAASPGVYEGGSLVQAHTTSASDVYRMTRVGAVFTVYRNGSQIWTASGKSTATMYVVFAHSNNASPGAESLTSVAINDDNNGTIGNMTLRPSSTTLDAADPETVSVYAVVTEVNGADATTDVQMRMSIDGGSTYTTAAARDVEYSSGSDRLLRFDMDTSGQTGSSAIWELTTLNNAQFIIKEVRGAPYYA
jgi:hypothetical protein